MVNPGFRINCDILASLVEKSEMMKTHCLKTRGKKWKEVCHEYNRIVQGVYVPSKTLQRRWGVIQKHRAKAKNISNDRKMPVTTCIKVEDNCMIDPLDICELSIPDDVKPEDSAKFAARSFRNSGTTKTRGGEGGSSSSSSSTSSAIYREKLNLAEMDGMNDASRSMQQPSHAGVFSPELQQYLDCEDDDVADSTQPHNARGSSDAPKTSLQSELDGDSQNPPPDDRVSGNGHKVPKRYRRNTSATLGLYLQSRAEFERDMLSSISKQTKNVSDHDSELSKFLLQSARENDMIKKKILMAELEAAISRKEAMEALRDKHRHELAVAKKQAG